MSQFPPLVEALLSPEAYPEKPQRVELVQTQISFVFLAGDLVYKVKKPVNFGFLDFSTLGKRKLYCEREVVLNQRLSPDLYLGVVPITRAARGYRVQGRGKTAEYAVKMRRLPEERMLSHLLQKGQATPEMLGLVAERMAAFHREAETSPQIASYGSLQAIRQNTDENFAQTMKYVDLSLSCNQYEALRRYTNGFLDRNASLFQRRRKEGRVRDCHGDLHSAHVCFTDGLVIYDCIEFNERFRYVDVASEVAFLAMDLDYHGRRDLSNHFIGRYLELSGDKELPKLLDFYKCYRAYVRGKVGSFLLDDLALSQNEKDVALERARRYFDLACSYATGLFSPALYIMAGLVGTGKTTLAEGIARSTGGQLISSDMVRKGLAGIPPQEHRLEEFNQGIYSPDFSRKTYDEMFGQAEACLARGCPAILDASFRKMGERQRAVELSRKAGVDLLMVECVAPEDIVRGRLERRLREEPTASDGRWEIYTAQKQDFEAVAEVPPERHLVVDTSRSPEDNLRLFLEKLVLVKGALND